MINFNEKKFFLTLRSKNGKIDYLNFLIFYYIYIFSIHTKKKKYLQANGKWTMYKKNVRMTVNVLILFFINY